jgi:hypothetical protein
MKTITIEKHHSKTTPFLKDGVTMMYKEYNSLRL